MYRRHDLNTGFSTERENLASDVKGNEQVADTMRKNTDAEVRGGAARSSDEALVMRVERRGSVIPLTKVTNLLGGDE